MILNAIRLHRDRITERDTFGYTRPVWDQMRYLAHKTPTLGCPIESDRPIQNRIIKLIEHYVREEGEFVVERFCWHQDRSLYPFRARYIHLNAKPMPTSGDTRLYDALDNNIMFLPNLQEIHRLQSGIAPSMMSSLQYYLNTSPPPFHHSSAYEYLMNIRHRYAGWIDGFGWMCDDWNAANEFVESFRYDSRFVYDEYHFRLAVLPKPKFLDPFSINAHARALSTREISPVESSMRMFDLSEAPPLEIKHPEHTHFSPAGCHPALACIEQIYRHYTDLKVEYILQNNEFRAKHVHHRVNRYRNVPAEQSVDDVRWTICNDLLPWLRTRTNDINDRLRFVDDIRVVFTLSFGEEVLFETFDNRTGDFLGAIHFDLAMLSLCASDIAVEFGRPHQSSRQGYPHVHKPYG